MRSADNMHGLCRMHYMLQCCLSRYLSDYSFGDYQLYALCFLFNFVEIFSYLYIYFLFNLSTHILVGIGVLQTPLVIKVMVRKVIRVCLLYCLLNSLVQPSHKAC